MTEKRFPETTTVQSVRVVSDLRKNQPLEDMRADWITARESEEAKFEAFIQRAVMLLEDRGIKPGVYVVIRSQHLFKIVSVATGVNGDNQFFFALNTRQVLGFSHDMKQVQLGSHKRFHCDAEWRLAEARDAAPLRGRANA